MDEIVVNDQVFSRDSDEEILVRLLLQAVGLDSETKVDLSDSQLAQLKSWILQIVEVTYQLNQCGIRSRHSEDFRSSGGPVEVIFVRKKLDDGTAVLWYDPMPWPEWLRNEERISNQAAPTMEVVKHGLGIEIVTSGMRARFNQAQTQKLLEGLRSAAAKVPPHERATKLLFNNGDMGIYEEDSGKLDGQIFIWFHFKKPTYSTCISFDKSKINWLLVSVESALNS
jgi:hypothetical protein